MCFWLVQKVGKFLDDNIGQILQHVIGWLLYDPFQDLTLYELAPFFLSLCLPLLIFCYVSFLSFNYLWLMSGFLDLVLNFPGYHRWRFTDVLRNILKIIVSLAWVIILPLLYFQSKSPINFPFKDLMKWLKQIKGVPELYILAVILYLLPNLLTVVLFLFPMLRRWIENSDWHIIRLLLWWSQVLNHSLILQIFVFLLNFLFSYLWQLNYTYKFRVKKTHSRV